MTLLRFLSRGCLLLPAILMASGQFILSTAAIEHPRLFFKKADIPSLKTKAASAEGQKMMNRLRALTALDSNGFTYNPARAGFPYCEGFWATGHALLYLVEGKSSELQRAMEVETLAMDLSGGEWGGWGRAHKLAGAAIAYDLVAEHWNSAFRQRVKEFLVQNSGVSWGMVPKDSNRGMMFAAASGLAALAVHGESDRDDYLKQQIDKVAEYLITFQKYGMGDKGWPNEWHGHAEMQDVVQAFLLGYKSVFGKNLALGTGFEWYGRLGVATGGKVMGDMGSSWAGITMGLTPESARPALRWVIEQYNVKNDTGLTRRENTYYHIKFPHHGLFALLYAVDIPPIDPATLLPPVLVDGGMNSFVFRQGYTGDRNFMTLLDGQARSEMPPVLTYDMALSGRGVMWLQGRRPSGIGEWHIESDSCVDRTHACPCVPRVDGLMPFHGAKLKYFAYASDGSGVVSLATDHYVEGIVRKSYFSTRADARVIPDTSNEGVGVLRSVAVDYSGAAGVPVLVSVYDRFSGVNGRNKSVQWNFGSGKGTVTGEEPNGRSNSETTRQALTGNKVTFCGSRSSGQSGTTIRATWVTPTDVKLGFQASKNGSGIGGGAVWSSGTGDDQWVIFTVQPGPAPAVQKQGSTVSIGSQTITFDGTKLVLGKFSGKEGAVRTGPGERTSSASLPISISYSGPGIHVTNLSRTAVVLQIFDSVGRTVAHYRIAAGNENHCIDLSRALPRGTYVVKAAAQGKQATPRLVFAR